MPAVWICKWNLDFKLFPFNNNFYSANFLLARNFLLVRPEWAMMRWANHKIKSWLMINLRGSDNIHSIHVLSRFACHITALHNVNMMWSQWRMPANNFVTNRTESWLMLSKISFWVICIERNLENAAKERTHNWNKFPEDKQIISMGQKRNMKLWLNGWRISNHSQPVGSVPLESQFF